MSESPALPTFQSILVALDSEPPTKVRKGRWAVEWRRKGSEVGPVVSRV